MSYRYNGIECDTAEEALALSRAVAPRAAPRSAAAPKRPKNMDQSARMKKMWVDARKLAEKEGISVSEAMKKLKK